MFARHQRGQSFTETLLLVAGVVLVAMLGFGILNAGVGSQSAAMAGALSGNANTAEVAFDRALATNALVDFDSVVGAGPDTDSDPIEAVDSQGSLAFLQGFASGVLESLWAELSTLLNPVETARAFVELGRLFVSDLLSTMGLLYDALIGSQVERFVNGTDYDRGFVVGNQVSPAKVLNVLARATGAANLVAIARRAAERDSLEAGSIRDVNPTGGTQNCVNCAIATDATLDGRPASALPGGVTPISVLERQFGARFRPVTGTNEIERILSDAGPGSRGIVFGQSRIPGQPGHVFNVVNQNGTIRFLDGQTGRSATPDLFQDFQFLPTN